MGEVQEADAGQSTHLKQTGKVRFTKYADYRGSSSASSLLPSKKKKKKKKGYLEDISTFPILGEDSLSLLQMTCQGPGFSQTIQVLLTPVDSDISLTKKITSNHR